MAKKWWKKPQIWFKMRFLKKKIILANFKHIMGRYERGRGLKWPKISDVVYGWSLSRMLECRWNDPKSVTCWKEPDGCLPEITKQNIINIGITITLDNFRHYQLFQKYSWFKKQLFINSFSLVSKKYTVKSRVLLIRNSTFCQKVTLHKDRKSSS